MWTIGVYSLLCMSHLKDSSYLTTESWTRSRLISLQIQDVHNVLKTTYSSWWSQSNLNCERIRPISTSHLQILPLITQTRAVILSRRWLLDNFKHTRFCYYAIVKWNSQKKRLLCQGPCLYRQEKRSPVTKNLSADNLNRKKEIEEGV
jgi:hypothetical protein